MLNCEKCEFNCKRKCTMQKHENTKHAGPKKIASRHLTALKNWSFTLLKNITLKLRTVLGSIRKQEDCYAEPEDSEVDAKKWRESMNPKIL